MNNLPIIGTGFDTHAFAGENEKRDLYLAGLFWEGQNGLLGNSDGDVACHAIADSLLNAAGMEDIGQFLQEEKVGVKIEGISGLKILELVYSAISKHGYTIGNISAQIISNSPKFAPRREEAEKVISKALNGAKISISATTTDGLGFAGRGEGIATIANCLIYKSQFTN
ncbi:MAG: 2-C-methyl-D-erythritol 2,4-cyclodiphosphate synthase [Candidatus Ancillula sp.]|jgi:2-C-methyl-D-erythritol 2,4-cyclodiphosphate synthase|nr:2-C-methyl-D-erythritol 2,4-cyclodiphosphate synthase [Candidatus Ancillula sp.]